MDISRLKVEAYLYLNKKKRRGVSNASHYLIIVALLIEMRSSLYTVAFPRSSLIEQTSKWSPYDY